MVFLSQGGLDPGLLKKFWFKFFFLVSKNFFFFLGAVFSNAFRVLDPRVWIIQKFSS